jgi:hypothetical protein
MVRIFKNLFRIQDIQDTDPAESEIIQNFLNPLTFGIIPPSEDEKNTCKESMLSIMNRAPQEGHGRLTITSLPRSQPEKKK